MPKKPTEFDFSLLTPPWLDFKKKSNSRESSSNKSIEELDMKIKELKSVEQWLNLNLGILQSTIQGLEVQKNTIIALTSINKTSAKTQSGTENKSTNEDISNIMANATSLWWSNVEEQMEKFLNNNRDSDSETEKTQPIRKRKRKPKFTVERNQK